MDPLLSDDDAPLPLPPPCAPKYDGFPVFSGLPHELHSPPLPSLYATKTDMLCNNFSNFLKPSKQPLLFVVFEKAEEVVREDGVERTVGAAVGVARGRRGRRLAPFEAARVRHRLRDAALRPEPKVSLVRGGDSRRLLRVDELRELALRETSLLLCAAPRDAESHPLEPLRSAALLPVRVDGEDGFAAAREERVAQRLRHREPLLRVLAHERFGELPPRLAVEVEHGEPLRELFARVPLLCCAPRVEVLSVLLEIATERGEV
mmetsp:Transcript_13275/g.43745  ORF Transcript_13275/g.43745 Transcript_13275/m.43745 type:complete len:262 (+) Transcript_13275:219-1004(+)